MLRNEDKLLIILFISRPLLLLPGNASIIVSLLANVTSLVLFSSTEQESPFVGVLSKTAWHQVPKPRSCDGCSETASAETAVAMAAGASLVDLPS